MSDQPGKPTADAGAKDVAANPAQAAQVGQVPLVIKAQYVKDLSFENPRGAANLQAVAGQPAIEVSVNVGAQHIAGQDYEVTITISAEAKAGGERIFLVELTYGGVVGLGTVPLEHMRPLLLIEGPRLLFPFARNIIADATREGGFPPLLLQPIDFVELYRREIAQQQARTA